MNLAWVLRIYKIVQCVPFSRQSSRQFLLEIISEDFANMYDKWMCPPFSFSVQSYQYIKLRKKVFLIQIYCSLKKVLDKLFMAIFLKTSFFWRDNAYLKFPLRFQIRKLWIVMNISCEKALSIYRLPILQFQNYGVPYFFVQGEIAESSLRS